MTVSLKVTEEQKQKLISKINQGESFNLLYIKPEEWDIEDYGWEKDCWDDEEEEQEYLYGYWEIEG